MSYRQRNFNQYATQFDALPPGYPIGGSPNPGYPIGYARKGSYGKRNIGITIGICSLVFIVVFAVIYANKNSIFGIPANNGNNTPIVTAFDKFGNFTVPGSGTYDPSYGTGVLYGHTKGTTDVPAYYVQLVAESLDRIRYTDFDVEHYDRWFIGFQAVIAGTEFADGQGHACGYRMQELTPFDAANCTLVTYFKPAGMSRYAMYSSNATTIGSTVASNLKDPENFTVIVRLTNLTSTALDQKYQGYYDVFNQTRIEVCLTIDVNNAFTLNQLTCSNPNWTARKASSTEVVFYTDSLDSAYQVLPFTWGTGLLSGTMIVGGLTHITVSFTAIPL